MANHIDDATIEYVGILAKLELSGEEKEQAKKDMESMLDYVGQRLCRAKDDHIGGRR